MAFVQEALFEPPRGIDATRLRWHCKATRNKVMLAGDAARFEWDF